MRRALRLLVALSGLAGIALVSEPIVAADWPSRPVTIVVPFGAGGNTDMMARLAAQHLSAKFGQSFVVENRPSAGGALGTGQVAAAAPDGYTLLFAASSMIVLTPQLQKLNFDPMEQLVPITNVGIGTARKFAEGEIRPISLQRDGLTSQAARKCSGRPFFSQASR
jgi:tripartite-type tricarboxylate transporter receptor subunit TctC